MRERDIGFYLLLFGILLAGLFDSVMLTTIGCFISGAGFGLIARDKE